MESWWKTFLFAYGNARVPVFLLVLALNALIAMAIFFDMKFLSSFEILGIVSVVVFTWGCFVGYSNDKKTGSVGQFLRMTPSASLLWVSCILCFGMLYLGLSFSEKWKYPTLFIIISSFLVSTGSILIPFYLGCFVSRVARMIRGIQTTTYRLSGEKRLSVDKQFMESPWFPLTVLSVLGVPTFFCLFIFMMTGDLTDTDNWRRDDGSQAERLVEDTWKAEENTSQWVKHRNEKLGFEVMLPPGCKLEMQKHSYETAIYVSSACFPDQINGGVSIGMEDDPHRPGSEFSCGGGRLPVLKTNNPLSELHQVCYQNLRRGATSHIYRFLYHGNLYDMQFSYYDKPYSPHIEKAILNSFRFTD